MFQLLRLLIDPKTTESRLKERKVEIGQIFIPQSVYLLGYDISITVLVRVRNGSVDPGCLDPQNVAADRSDRLIVHQITCAVSSGTVDHQIVAL